MIQLREISINDSLYQEERLLRVKVLREPLGMPAGSEYFPFEEESRHFLALDGKRTAGCVLLHSRTPTGKLFQMAVHPEYQGRGVGKLLVEYLEREALTSGLTSVFCHARWEVHQFYLKLGFQPVGEQFEEIGIRHIEMVKTL